MKIFIIGLPKSGRTTVSKSLTESGFDYIDPVSWIKHTFRDQDPKESLSRYEEAYEEYLIARLKNDPELYIDNINGIMEASNEKNFVIDGLSNPRDIIHLFDYNTDLIVFLNRMDNEAEFKDEQNIAHSVIRDYCFWLASAKLIDKSKWLEFNFTIPGDPNNPLIRKLGTHNTVIIVKSIDRVTSYLKDIVKEG